MTMTSDTRLGTGRRKMRPHEQPSEPERTRSGPGQAEGARPTSPTRQTVPARPRRKLRLPAYVRHG